ncbi:hypothetical protein HYALB_00000618 [Hymenoscyphus albidus]|uniref:F5/8 type C domain-containing protein n=1 Tax=Hymenoscyphus albidus TaxID=595503 RepID=A0A9N9LYJ8_9HELO|nr:hypothetical protein HYALB_00000618 [Hymenoscyphus albidus]
MVFSSLTATVLVFISFIALAASYPLLDHTPSKRATTLSDVTYILPIWEGALANHTRTDDLAVLADMKNRLGTGIYTRLGWSFSSWSLSRDIFGADKDYNFDPTNLRYMLDLAVDEQLPILVHMNNGRWADCCTPNSSGGWGDALLDFIAGQPNTTVLNSAGVSQFGHDFGSNYFTLSRLNDVYIKYKKRNVQAAAKVLVEWSKDNPGLFVGVSLDSETLMVNSESDFNPLAIEEWKMWLRNTELYGPGGAYHGNGRVPAFDSIGDFNTAMGTNFTSWDTMSPPKGGILPGNIFYEEWERWRVLLIVHATSDETLWLEQAGLERTVVYGHQQDDYGFADSVDTFTAANGAGGITNYGWKPADLGMVDSPARGQGRNNYGNFELNPQTPDETISYNSILTLFNDGMKIMCPNSWENSEVKDQYAIFDSPNFGDTFGNALANFFKDFGNTKRYTQPPPWNPGNKIADLYDLFPNAITSGPDNQLKPTLSVGNIVRKSVYSAVGGSITFSVTLPPISGDERINFWASLGIQDGAGSNGGEVTFQATINGESLYGPGFHLHPNYWFWKRWVPMMVDVTKWAGQNISVTLTTTGNENNGWTSWGAPAFYVTATGNDLAAGKPVTASPTDGDSVAWDPSYLLDGNIDGGSNGRSGWTSVLHSSADATEWVQIDLQGLQTVGKVVLFPRSDVFEGTGSGIPVDFKIQGSSDGTTWKDLVTEVGYPGTKAGEGEAFVFPAQEIGYVKVVGSKLRGSPSENGYRFQMADLQVYG